MPFLFVNGVALAAAFETGRIVDPTAFARMAAARGEAYATFHIKHLLVHWVPVLMMWTWLRLNRARYRAILSWSPATGVYTATVHLVWAYANFGTLDLSGVYVVMEKSHWETMWTVAVATHVAAGMLWRFVI